MGVRVLGYTADADVWCKECCESQYDGQYDSHGNWYATDREGNEIWPIFSTDDRSERIFCCACHWEI